MDLKAPRLLRLDLVMHAAVVAGDEAVADAAVVAVAMAVLAVSMDADAPAAPRCP